MPCLRYLAANALLLLALVNSAHGLSILRGPYLQSANANEIVIKWRTDDPAISRLYYREQADPITVKKLISEVSDTEHTFLLTELKSNTFYHYWIESETASGSLATLADEHNMVFRTAPRPYHAEPTHLWVIGDSGTQGSKEDESHWGKSRRVYEAFLTKQKRPDLWLLLGDNAYPDGTDQQYQKAFFEVYPELLRSTPVWPVLGNHEKDHDTYLDIFHLPTRGECGGVPSGSEYYYSFNWGNIHFVALDTFFVGREASTGEGMYAWLEDDLAQCQSDWIIAYFHQPVYSKGSRDSDDDPDRESIRVKALPILESHGVDLVLTGHSHCYERSFLMNGHYGKSKTLERSMILDPGNGSEFGRVDENGQFLTDGGDGAYQKTQGRPHEGLVSAVVGSSGKATSWDSGSKKLVNPKPHPAIAVSLLREGSLSVKIEGSKLHSQFIDLEGQVRDDFSIIKQGKLALESQGDSLKIHRAGDTTDPLQAFLTIQPEGDLTRPIAKTVTIPAGLSQFTLSPSDLGINFLGRRLLVSLAESDAYQIAYQHSSTILQALDGNASTNRPPISSLHLSETKELISGQKISIQAEAFDPGGQIHEVQVYINGIRSTTLDKAPFQYSWTPRRPGKHVLTILPIDNEGQSGLASHRDLFVKDFSPPRRVANPLGRLVLEAEHFHDSHHGPKRSGWHITEISNVRGVKTDPLEERTTDPNEVGTPRLRYEGILLEPGPYQVHLRHRSDDSSSDSVFFKVNDQVWRTISGRANRGWVWTVFEIGNLDAGPVEIELAMRESGFAVDQIVIEIPDRHHPPSSTLEESLFSGQAGSSFSEWKAIHKLGDHLDEDQDQIPTLIEYAQGSDPLTTERFSNFFYEVQADQSLSLYLRLALPPREDLVYQLVRFEGDQSTSQVIASREGGSRWITKLSIREEPLRPGQQLVHFMIPDSQIDNALAKAFYRLEVIEKVEDKTP